jgi:hypothetical protein
MSDTEEIKRPTLKVDGRKLGSSSRNLAKARKAKLEQLSKLRAMKGLKMKDKQREKTNCEEEYAISEDSSSSSESSEEEEDEEAPEEMLTRSVVMPPTPKRDRPVPAKPKGMKHQDEKIDQLYKMIEKMNKKKPKKRAKRKTVVKIINHKAPVAPTPNHSLIKTRELLRF